MNREQAVATLREHEQELKAAGVVRLSVFGSTARGDRRPDSDIDLLAAFDRSMRISLLDVARFEIQLSELLGHQVDLVEEGTLKPRVRESVESEAVRAFQRPCDQSAFTQDATRLERISEAQIALNWMSTKSEEY